MGRSKCHLKWLNALGSTKPCDTIRILAADGRTAVNIEAPEARAPGELLVGAVNSLWSAARSSTAALSLGSRRAKPAAPQDRRAQCACHDRSGRAGPHRPPQFCSGPLTHGLPIQELGKLVQLHAGVVPNALEDHWTPHIALEAEGRSRDAGASGALPQASAGGPP